MPNNCFFNMTIKGNPKNIKKFINYFIFEDDEENKTGDYLARTFLDNWKNKKEFIKEKKEDIENGETDLFGWCAWSCWSCWFEGYPEKFEDCITLSEACKICKVSVECESEEGGCGFEEQLSCNELGETTYSSNDMPTYVCKCGNEEMIASSYDLNDYICCECNECGTMELLEEKE